MAQISVIGAGAFGTSLAISFARKGHDVTLVARGADHAREMVNTRENTRRLPGFELPQYLTPSAHIERADIFVLAIPMQTLAAYVQENAALLSQSPVVACCKGLDLQTLKGPSAIMVKVGIERAFILSGPSFAVDIAAGLPTALTLAGHNEADLETLQNTLSTQNIRLYSTTDPLGVELGGGLKNVIALACGMAIGAGLGESARAALMTRGFAEILKLGQALGALPQTFHGLSGFGDLVLTATSEKSRNFSHGLSLGAGNQIDASKTVEGIATAKAVHKLAQNLNLDLPIIGMVDDILSGKTNVKDAVQQLLARPLRKE